MASTRSHGTSRLRLLAVVGVLALLALSACGGGGSNKGQSSSSGQATKPALTQAQVESAELHLCASIWNGGAKGAKLNLPPNSYTSVIATLPQNGDTMGFEFLFADGSCGYAFDYSTIGVTGSEPDTETFAATNQGITGMLLALPAIGTPGGAATAEKLAAEVVRASDTSANVTIETNGDLTPIAGATISHYPVSLASGEAVGSTNTTTTTTATSSAATTATSSVATTVSSTATAGLVVLW
jgi:hypothetical protein